MLLHTHVYCIAYYYYYWYCLHWAVPIKSVVGCDVASEVTVASGCAGVARATVHIGCLIKHFWLSHRYNGCFACYDGVLAMTALFTCAIFGNYKSYPRLIIHQILLAIAWRNVRR